MLALSGCGVGFGAGEQEGSAGLTVSRDYGAEVLVDQPVGPLGESSTVMRLLDDQADIETQYGGGFVDSIDGVTSRSGARSLDWFYFVNGIAAERGAAEFVAQPGDRIWWDFRDWDDAMNVNAVVGSFPAPLRGGYDRQVWPVSLVCLDTAPACRAAEANLEEAGVEIAAGDPGSDSLRVLVGTWNLVKRVPDAGRLDSGPASSGVFARFVEGVDGQRLVGLDREAQPTVDFGPDAGLVAAMRWGSNPPVWLVTGSGRAGVEAAAGALTPDDLRGRYAAAVSPGGAFSLPVRSGPYESAATAVAASAGGKG